MRPTLRASKLFPPIISCIYLSLAVLGLHCFTGFFSSCSKWGLLSSYGERASHCSGFSCCGAWAQGHMGFAVGVHGLSSCGSWVLQHRLNCSWRASKLLMNEQMHAPDLEKTQTLATFIMHTYHFPRTILNTSNMFSHLTLRTTLKLQMGKLKHKEITPCCTQVAQW